LKRLEWDFKVELKSAIKAAHLKLEETGYHHRLFIVEDKFLDDPKQSYVLNDKKIGEAIQFYQVEPEEGTLAVQKSTLNGHQRTQNPLI